MLGLTSSPSLELGEAMCFSLTKLMTDIVLRDSSNHAVEPLHS